MNGWTNKHGGQKALKQNAPADTEGTKMLNYQLEGTQYFECLQSMKRTY